MEMESMQINTHREERMQRMREREKKTYQEGVHIGMFRFPICLVVNEVQLRESNHFHKHHLFLFLDRGKNIEEKEWKREK